MKGNRGGNRDVLVTVIVQISLTNTRKSRSMRENASSLRVLRGSQSSKNIDRFRGGFVRRRFGSKGVLVRCGFVRMAVRAFRGPFSRNLSKAILVNDGNLR